MAVVTNTFTTYDAIGQKEDLSDIISMISPTDTPFTSALKKEKATARNFEWQTDALDAAANNKHIEGDDITAFDAVTPTVLLNNYCQIMRKTFVIAATEEVVDKAGRDSEIAKQTRKKLAEIKRDKEFAYIQNGSYNAGATATARQTRGLAGFITNGSVGAGVGAMPVVATNTAPVAGTARAFDEAILKDMIQDAYTDGGSNWTLYVRPADKVLASAFTGNATRYQDVAENKGKLVAAYDVYVSDFGAIKIVPNRFMDAAAYLIDHDYVTDKTLRPVTRQKLAQTGDAEKFLIVGESGLKVDNPDAHAQARDLS